MEAGNNWLTSGCAGWLNRFANAADSALSWTQSVHQQVRYILHATGKIALATA